MDSRISVIYVATGVVLCGPVGCEQNIYHACTCSRRCEPVDLWVVGSGQNIDAVCSKKCRPMRPVGCGQNVYPVCSKKCRPMDLWTCGL